MRSFLSGVQIPSLARLNVDGELTLDAQAGTTGELLVSQGAGNTPIWSKILTSPTIDIINAASSSSTTAELFANITTGTVGIADGLTTGTLNIGNASTGIGGRTININTNASGSIGVTTNIGSSVIGSTINLAVGLNGVVFTSTGLMTTSAVTGGNSSTMTLRTGNTTTSGNSGNLVLDVGTAAGTAGTISIGTTSASAITIGRSGLTTTVGGNLTADQVFSTSNGSGTNFKVGDDAWVGDINLANTISVRGQQNPANGYIAFGDANGTALGRAGSGPLTYDGEKVSSSSMVFSRATVTTSQPAPGTYTVNIFASANDVLSGISAATLYAFRAKFFLSTTYTSGANTTTIPLTFSNAPANIKYSFKTYPESPGSTMTRMGAGTTTTIAPVASSLTSAGTWVVEVEGYFNSHATLSSTLTPVLSNNIATSSGGAASITTGSWFEVEKLGTSTQTLIAGNWA